MVVFCHHKTGLDPVLEEKKQWNKWVLKGRRSWGPLHSVIMKWELSFWISYFNTIGKIMWIIYPATVCRCFLPCTTQSRLSLALPLCSLFSKTENPALILTDRPCIQNSAWVNICTTLFFFGRHVEPWRRWWGWGGPSGTGREEVSAGSCPLASSWPSNRRRGEGFDAAVSAFISRFNAWERTTLLSQ